MGQHGQDPSQGVLQLGAWHHHVDHAVVQQVFGPLEALRQGFTDGGLDHPGAREADHGPGLGDGDVAQHGEGGGDATGGGVGQQHHVGQARVLDLVDGHGGPGHLHQRQDAFLHARPARGGNGDEGGLLQHGQFGRGHQTLAHGHAHGATHEVEVEGRHHDVPALEFAMGHQDGVLGAGLGLGFLQAVAIALQVLEPQGVEGNLGQLDGRVLATVEQQLHAALHGKTHVVAAMGADLEGLFQFLMEDHVAAGGAFPPEVLGNLLGANQAADLGADEVCQPVHGSMLFPMAR
jgi:hypothetical protein